MDETKGALIAHIMGDQSRWGLVKTRLLMGLRFVADAISKLVACRDGNRTVGSPGRTHKRVESGLNHQAPGDCVPPVCCTVDDVVLFHRRPGRHHPPALYIADAAGVTGRRAVQPGPLSVRQNAGFWDVSVCRRLIKIQP